MIISTNFKHLLKGFENVFQNLCLKVVKKEVPLNVTNIHNIYVCALGGTGNYDRYYALAELVNKLTS